MRAEGTRTKQPNSRHCFACGLENPHGLQMTFYEVDAEEVVAEYAVESQFEGYPGIVHGGIIASMLDEMLTRAVMIRDHHRFMVTAKMNLRFRRPVPTEEPLKLRGQVLEHRGRLATAKAELLLPDGSLAAEATATFAEMKDSIADPEELEALGWRIYADSPQDEG